MPELKNNVPNLFTDGGFLSFLQKELESKDEKRKSRASDIFDNLASYFTKIPGYMDAANEYMKQQAKGLFESSEAVRRSQRTDNPGDRFDSLRVMPLNTRISRAQTVGEREELLKSKQIKDRETAERLFRMGSMNGFNASVGVKRELAALRKENGVRSFGNIEAFRGRKDGDRELVMNDAYRNARTIEFGDDGSRTTTVGVRRAEELLRQKQKEEERHRFDLQNQADMFGGTSNGARQPLQRGWLDSLFTTTAAFKGGRSSKRRS